MYSNKVKLRQEVFKSDAFKIINWMEDKEITQYLNERQNVSESIKTVMNRINMPILTHLFNQNGSFFIITEDNSKEAIGFLKLVPKSNVFEMVIVIGDKEKWGNGLGSNAIKEGLKHAFFNCRSEEVIAKINYKNERSHRAFKKIGFEKTKNLANEVQYSMSMNKFLKLAA